VPGKRLFLLRHAKSSWDDTTLDDVERPLNKRGKHDAPFMGRRLRQAGCMPACILSSHATRAFATARVIARELGYPVRGIVRDSALYLAQVETLLSCVHTAHDGLASLMLVGHNPGLTDFANALTPQRIDDLPTCGVYCADFAIDHWSELEPGSGTFVCFDYPKRAVDPNPPAS
jgi:phosphohistidine phosphatase